MINITDIIDIHVLEDNSGDFLLIEELLIERCPSVNITHRTSFAESEKLAAEKNNFSVILLDLILPDLQKEELVEKVQKIYKNVPIIILTGYTDMTLARSLLSKGVADFLLKDEINAEILYKTIAYAIEREHFIKGLENSKSTYQKLFNFSPQPMWLYDNDTLQFLDVNEAAIKKYGYSKEEFLKMTIKDIRPKKHEIYLEESIASRRNTKKTVFAGIFNHLLKSGKSIRVEIFSNFINYNSKETTLVLSNDITEKLKYLEVIESQNDKLRKIAWSQSHETRAPLARLLGLVNLLDIDLEQNDDNRFLLEQVKLSATELDLVIRKMVNESIPIDLKGEL